MEDELLPQLPLRKTKRFWQSLSRRTQKQTLETVTGEFHSNGFGNFVMSRDANDCYHFFDYINETIKRF